MISRPDITQTNATYRFEAFGHGSGGLAPRALVLILAAAVFASVTPARAQDETGAATAEVQALPAADVGSLAMVTDTEADGVELGIPGEDDTDLALGLADDEEDPDLDFDMDLDEAILFQEIPSVFGVSRFEQKITEAPSFVTLITAEDIRKYGYRTLAEALESVTGMFTTYDRNYNYLGVRGFNRPGDFNSRVLLLVDGHRMNDNLYDQAGLGTESTVDVDLVERIEVIRGPSSSVYGTNAFFGVINVIMKRGRDIRGSEVSVELGSFNTWRVRGTYGNKLASGVEMLVSGSYAATNGPEYLYYPEFDNSLAGNPNLQANNNGITQNADDDQYPSFFGKLTFRDFTLEGGFVTREKGIPTAAYGTFFPTEDTRSTDQHGYIFLRYDHQFENKVNVMGRIYYDNFFYKGDYLYDVTDPPTPMTPDLVLNQDLSNGEWWGFEGVAERRFFDSHNVTGGVEFRHNFRQDLSNSDVSPPPPINYLDEQRDTWNVAFFLQDEWTIVENLILNAGFRYDYYDNFGDTVNPRIALIYNWRDKTTFKALYGTAFRAPNAYENFYEGTGFVPNPDLDPEEIATYELVVEHAIKPYIRATGAGYYYKITDLISQELLPAGDPSCQATPGEPCLRFENRENIEALGLEVQLEMDDRGPLGIAGKIGYAVQRARDATTKQNLTNSPTHLVNLNLAVPLYKDKIYTAFELLYASQRETLAGDFTSDTIKSNLTLTGRNIVRGLELTVSVRNLFDLDYADPGSGDGVHIQDQIPQDGRTFWLKAKYAF